MVTANVDEFDRSADKYSGGYEPLLAEETIRVTQTNLREENVTRGRTGGSFVMDYRIPNGQITANSFFNRSQSESLHRINNLNAGANRHYFDMDIRENTTDLFTGAAGIEQSFDWIEYDFTVSRTLSRAENPEDYSWRFGKEGAAFTSQPTKDTLPTDIPGFAVNDSLSTLTHIWVTGADREENVTATELNLRMPFDAGWTNGYVKFGGKLKWLDRFNDETQIGRAGLQYGNGGGLNDPLACIDNNLSQYDLQGAADQTGDGGLPVRYFLDNYSRDNFLNGNYGLGFTYSADMMMQMTRALQSCGGPDNRNYQASAIGSEGRDYDGIERYQAAYIMAEFDFFDGKIKLIPGARWEADYSKYNGQRFIEQISAFEETEPADFTELTNTRDHSFLLPMVHLQYSPSSWLQVRLARTETLSRPDYIQYAPISTMNTYRDYIRAANGALRPSHSENYDVSVSIYENRIGYFSVSAFHKNISDLILSLNYKVHPDVPQLPGMNLPESWVNEQPTYGADTYINNPYDAMYQGVEFDWQTNFWYLPSVFKGLVLSANYTYMQSEMTFQRYFLETTDEVKIPGRPPTYFRGIVDDSLRTGRMPDQPKHVANVTLGYDYKGFSTRISYLYQSDVSSGINLNNPILDTFTGSYTRWDLSVRQKMPVQGLELYGNFNNLTSTRDRTYRTSANATNRPAYIENYGFTMDVGVRYRF
jgi:TonB-dependent receptor